ncbi:MAG: hypothetical protein V3S41_00180 [Spirochaetia bacterium]
MKKVALIFAALLLLLPLTLSAQVIVDDDFATLGDWVPGYGEWGIRGGMLVQRDTDTGLARIDRMVPQSGEIEISFKVRYEAGGFESQAALRSQQFHAGFGIHVGVENPPLGRVAWGAGNSYLLWLNLDTRAETARDAREHLGFRAQVYESAKNSEMTLGSAYNVDIIAALNAAGISMALEDLATFVASPVQIKIRVNVATGKVMVMDPTNPTLWFAFDVDRRVLRGDYISLRTNGLAVSFSDFAVRQR